MEHSSTKNPLHSLHPLLDAVKRQDTYLIQSLSKKYPVDEHHGLYMEAILLTCQSGDLNTLKFLFSLLNDTEIYLPVDDLILMALLCNNLEVVNYLGYEFNLDLNQLYDRMFKKACMDGNITLVKLFVEKCNVDIYDVNSDFLTYVVSGICESKFVGGSPKLKRSKLKYGQKIAYDTPMTYIFCDVDGRLEVLRYLLEEKGADVNGNNGEALAVACQWGDIELFKLLVEKYKADIDIVDVHGIPYIRDPREVFEYIERRKMGSRMLYYAPVILRMVGAIGVMALVYYKYLKHL